MLIYSEVHNATQQLKSMLAAEEEDVGAKVEFLGAQPHQLEAALCRYTRTYSISQMMISRPVSLPYSRELTAQSLFVFQIIDFAAL